MKLNGALKPRQGASTKGSSPGVVLKKYRIKRYFKVNENVINSLPLKTCGVENKDLTKNIINGYYTYNSNQHQATTPLLHNQEQQKKCDKKLCHSISSSSSSSRIKFSTSVKTKQQIYLKNYKWNRVPQITKRKACIYNLNSRGNKNKVFQTQVAAVVKTRAAEAIEKHNKKTGKEIDFTAKAVINITTRQTKKTILNEESQNKNTNNINKVKQEKQEKAFKTTSNTLKYRFALNKNHDNNKSSTPKEVNKFFFISQINKNLNLAVTFFWRLFIQLKLLLFSMFSHAIKYFYANPFARCGGSGRVTAVAKMMRVSQFSEGSLKRICFTNARRGNSPIALCLLLYTATAIFLPHPVVGDTDDTFFPINGLETTTPEFDYASRGQKKFGDKCENTLECGFPGSICDPKKKSCQCTEDLPVTNHIDKCGKEAAVNESCFFNEQCEVKYFQTECRDHRCVCRFDMTPIWLKDGSVECKGRGDKKGPETYIDPAMIGVLIGMALMFIIICVVLRLFSQARWRENRTIFNTPNPRLMNVSLLRESKLLHGQERRGSRMSVRAPSRQPSMASLRPHSPNPSLGKTGSRSNSHGSNASGTSLKSTRSNSVSPAGIINGNNSHHERKGSTYQPHQHQHSPQQKLQSLQQEEQQPLTQTNIISNPVAETVTVEIIEPENK